MTVKMGITVYRCLLSLTWGQNCPFIHVALYYPMRIEKRFIPHCKSSKHALTLFTLMDSPIRNGTSGCRCNNLSCPPGQPPLIGIRYPGEAYPYTGNIHPRGQAVQVGLSCPPHAHHKKEDCFRIFCKLFW